MVFFRPRRNSRRRLLSNSYPYTAARSILTPGELAFLPVLRQAVPPGVEICPKVRLADVLICPEDFWDEHGWRVSSKHLDFVLADDETLAPLLCVELDDASHHDRDRQRRDQFLDEALAAVGLPLLHVRAMRQYPLEELKAIIAEVVG